MSAGLPVAFYAPLKSPHHPAPSGDRTMARLLIDALRAAEFAPSLASEIRTLDRTGSEEIQGAVRARALDEGARLIEAFRALPPADRPHLWFTYHVYYKAPDWIGPVVADSLRIPYAVAEGSRAPKRARGRWALGHLGAEAALDRADAILVMNPADREALEQARPSHQRLIDLPPFLDDRPWRNSPRRKTGDGSAVRLLTVAMMREGDKLASYRLLAAALGALAHLDWTLTIVGGGEAAIEVRRLFEPFGERIRFTGPINDQNALGALYAASDLFVWPAVNEAYGMALLEAQATGCPVVAGTYGGVAGVVQDGRTGLLTPRGDVNAFARAVGRLIESPDQRRSLAEAACRFIAEERGLAPAARRLGEGLRPLVEGLRR